MTALEAEIYPWTESNPAERLSEEHGGTGGANAAATLAAWFAACFEVVDGTENFTYGLMSQLCKLREAFL